MTSVESVEHAFSRLADQYLVRKARAEQSVHSWEWATFARFDVRPLHFEKLGETPGRRLRQAPANPSGRFAYGADRAGRIWVVRQFNEFGRFYETFFDWTTDPLEVAHYHSWPEKPPINLLVVQRYGTRVLQSDVSATGGYTRELYRWHGAVLQEVEVHYARRIEGRLDVLRPLHVARPHYDAAGVLQRVELVWPASPPEKSAESIELMFERRGKRIWRRPP